MYDTQAKGHPWGAQAHALLVRSTIASFPRLLRLRLLMLMDVCYLFTPAQPEAGAQHLTQASLLKSFRLWVLVPGPGTQIKGTKRLQVCCKGSGHALTEYHCLSDLFVCSLSLLSLSISWLCGYSTRILSLAQISQPSEPWFSVFHSALFFIS